MSAYIRACQLKNELTQQDFKLPEVAASPSKAHMGAAKSESLTPELLGEWVERYPEIQQGHTLYLPQGAASELVSDYQPNDASLQAVPLYVHTTGNRVINLFGDREIYIQYCHTYAWNGKQPLCGLPFATAGEHQADIEHVTAHVVASQSGHLSLRRMYFARHNGGVWLEGEALQFEDTHPVVYPSKNGHASWHTPGFHLRYYGVVADRCKKGRRWFSQTLHRLYDTYEENLPDLRWCLFRGDLGNGAVANFCLKSWWQAPDVEEEYGRHLLCCLWCH
jgi:hypothetical protein